MKSKAVLVAFLLMLYIVPMILGPSYTGPGIGNESNFTLSAGEGWLNGWTYRRSLEINHSAGAGTNYTVPVAITYDGPGAVTDFEYVSKTGADVQASQGVATDGTDFWTTSGGTAPPPNNMYLYKYNSAWALQDSRDCASDGTEEMQQINHAFYFDGHVYVGANNYNNATKRSWILKYDADTLALDDAIELKDDSTWINGWTEGCSRYNGSWWVVWTDRMKVTQYSNAWDYTGEYDLSYTITGDAAAKYQSIFWLGNFAYFNIHYNGEPDKIDAYHFNGTVFSEVARLDQPHAEAGQGMALDPTDNETVYFAIRGGADNEKVCWATVSLGGGGDFDIGGKCKTDFSDLRFTDNDGVSLLSYWLQHKVDSSIARFWINVNDSLSTEAQTIWCYYGNPDAESLSDGWATFPFFDDFNRADNNDVGGTWTDDVGDGANENSIYSNTLAVNSYEHYYSHVEDDMPALTDFCVEGMVYNANDTSGTWHPSLFLYWTAYEWFSIGPRMDGQEKHHGYDNDGGTTNHYGEACAFDTWYYYKIMLNSTDINIDSGTSWTAYDDAYDMERTAAFEGQADLLLLGKGFSVSGGSYPNADLDNNGGVTGDSNLGSSYDDIFVRKYVYPEPAQQAWSEEKELPIWSVAGEVELLFIAPIDEWGLDMLLIFLGLIMIPLSILYLVKGGKSEMSSDKLFYGLIAFAIGWALFLGGIM